MMFAKTFCKSGSYVEVAPIGLQALLQYNRNGLLQKVMLLEPDGDKMLFSRALGSDALNRIYQLVPTTINLKDGTTWVEGTFFTQALPVKSYGNIAYCANDEFLEMLLNGTPFTFYAATVKSLAASFKGPLTIRNWLMGNGFKVLPGIVVPLEMKQETLDMMFSTFNASFNPKFIASFYIFHGIDEVDYKLANLYYSKVVNCEMKLTSDGYVKGLLTLDTGKIVTVHYSDACNNFCDAAPNVRILYGYDEEGNIDIITGITDHLESRTATYMCPVCHANVMVPTAGPCQCSDPNCLSRLYPDSCKMLSRLNLPELTYEQYAKLVENKDILCLTDILTSVDNFKDMKITATLAETVAAITPIEVVPDMTFFEKLANSCNNSPDSLLYYLTNPNRILTELNMNSPDARRFAQWIAVPYNFSSVTTLLGVVNITERTKKFEGAPIFRSNAFVLTGKFKRGSYKEIASILESYDATVLPDIELSNRSVKVTCVITGSTNENISGQVIKSAKFANIPIVEEDTFFATYGIDQDLAANLL